MALLSFLLSLTLVAASSIEDEIIVVEGEPRVAISLDPVDLANAHAQRGIESRIHRAAIYVCERAYRTISYRESVACVKGTIANAEAQLERLRKSPSISNAALAITISANHSR